VVPVTPLRVIRIAADLRQGDVLRLTDRDVLITGLTPKTRKAALEYGYIEVRSGSWWQTCSATEPVAGTPRRSG
jgi:hypothetical protein